MLTLLADQPECLWDDALPIEVRELPADLAALDLLLADHELLFPLVERWRQEFVETGRSVLTEGRPTIPLESYVRLMVLKQRYRWGYRTLVAEVSDSIHLRRFCRISLTERVPDESTVRKLTRRIGAETVAEITRAMIVQATREKRFVPRAVRIDSTVIEAGIKHPSDAGLASVGVRALAREGRKLARLVKEKRARVRDRSRAMGQKLRGIARTVRRRSERCAQADRADGRVVGALDHGGASACGCRQAPGARSRRRRELVAVRRLQELTDRCEKVAAQIRQRLAGETITDRIVSLTDPDARPIRKGKIGKVTDFGYVSQLAEVTEHTRSGARGLILPASHQLGNPSENTLLPGTVAELTRLGIKPREVAVDGGFQPAPTNAELSELGAKTVFIAGRQEPASRHTNRRLAPPNRQRGPDQPPQTSLRAGPIPPERRRRRADLD